MGLNSFVPNTIIQSQKINQNFQNLENHALNLAANFYFPGVAAVSTLKMYVEFPDAGAIERVDVVADTPPTGQAIIVDIEYSDDDGATWASIFTNQANRPQIAAGARRGTSTSINVPAVVANDRLYRAAIDQVGSGTAGADITAIIKGAYNLD